METNMREVINSAIQGITSEERDLISDGYHTFGELYHYRALYNAALANVLAAHSIGNVYKSWKHSDGKPCFEKGEYFIVSITLPDGPITNHYQAEYWNHFTCAEREMAEAWDGHTPADAAKRLERFVLSFGRSRPPAEKA